MRIGILTVPFNNNYGGFLQAFALKKVLQDMGLEVVFINRRRNKNTNYRVIIKKALIKLGVCKDRIKELTDILNKANYDYYVLDNPTITDQEFDKYLKKGLRITKILIKNIKKR